jgi:hypothetical protein
MTTLILIALVVTSILIYRHGGNRSRVRQPGQTSGTPWFSTGVYQAQPVRCRNARLNSARHQNRRGNSARWR